MIVLVFCCCMTITTSTAWTIQIKLFHPVCVSAVWAWLNRVLSSCNQGIGSGCVSEAQGLFLRFLGMGRVQSVITGLRTLLPVGLLLFTVMWSSPNDSLLLQGQQEIVFAVSTPSDFLHLRIQDLFFKGIQLIRSDLPKREEWGVIAYAIQNFRKKDKGNRKDTILKGNDRNLSRIV